MSEATILFVDNDADFLVTRADFLRRAGFEVILASSLEQAKESLRQNQIDLAVLDIRLTDDDDEKDTSGLTLAQDMPPSIPKIVLTNFPTLEAVRIALGPGMRELPPAEDFVDKREGPAELIAAIRRALALHVEE